VEGGEYVGHIISSMRKDNGASGMFVPVTHIVDFVFEYNPGILGRAVLADLSQSEFGLGSSIVSDSLSLSQDSGFTSFPFLRLCSWIVIVILEVEVCNASNRGQATQQRYIFNYLE